MRSINSVAAAASLWATTVAAYGINNGSLYPMLAVANHTCAIQPEYLSCSVLANPSRADSCCVETFGGLVLSTQFWNTWADKPIPQNTWTLHGLWPDFCNGSFTQYCDLSRQFDPVPSPNTTNGLPNGTAVPAYKGADIGTFLQPFGAYDLLAYMNKYWLSNLGPNADFWGHEFSKHATCYSSFQVPCYGPAYRKNEDVLDFFETAVKYYQKFPTWEWLAKHNVLPSNKTQYSIGDFETALTIESGALPYVGCSGPRYNDTDAGKKANSTDTGRTVISELWYYTHTFGRPQNVRYVPVDQTGKSSCTNETGALWYYQPAANNTA